MDRLEKAYNKGSLCNEFLPVPEGYYDDGRWYDWCINNWQTKWDVGADIGTEREEYRGLKATRVGNQISATFDSAWAPPLGLYEKLIELGYNVKATYWEPGLAFCGIWDNGADNYIDYGNFDKPEEAIPVALWNEFNMEEFLSDDEIEA